MRVTLIVLISVLPLQAAAQNAPASAVFGSQATVAQRSQRVTPFETIKEPKPRVFDRKFFVLAGIATAATVMDLASCMSTYGDCQEGNPLLGSHPSHAKLYGVSFSMLAGQLLASAWVRREMPNRKLWMALPVIATAGHGLAAALNIRTMHQLRSAEQEQRGTKKR